MPGDVERMNYCALKDKVVRECDCKHDPRECWYFFIVNSQDELDYLRDVYRK